MRLTLALILLLLSTAAKAEEKSEEWVVGGLGAKTCSEFGQLYKMNPKPTENIFEY